MRSISWLSVAILLAAILSGCGGHSPVVDDAATTDEAQTAKIRVAIADTWIKSSSPAVNFGTSTALKCGVPATGQTARALIRFNLGSLPDGAIITQAELRLFATAVSSGPAQYRVHRATRSWSETGATWTNMNARYDATPVDVKTLGAGQAGTVVSWDVTQTVQDWYAGTNPNHGLMLIGPSGGGGMLATFAAKESATANRRPRLIIEYLETPPG